MQQRSIAERRARLQGRTVPRPIGPTRWLALVALAAGAAYLAYAVYAGLTDLNAEPPEAPAFLPAFLTTLSSTVTTTGAVEAQQQATLSFDIGGEVDSVEVAAGDEVAAGEPLATLNTEELEQALRSAESSLASAQARYAAAIEPASTNQVASAEQSVLSAETQLANAERAMQDLLDKPAPVMVDDAEQALLNAENVLANAKAAAEAADRQTGLPDGNLERSLEVAEIEVEQARARLVEARQPASPSEIEVAQRSIDLATAGLTAAEARYAELFEAPAPEVILPLVATVDQALAAVDEAGRDIVSASIVAPFAGTITEVNVSAGDRVTVTFGAFDLLNRNLARIDANVDQSDIANLAVGQPASVTVDALPGEAYQAVVAFVGLTPTVQQGVVTFLVTFDLETSNLGATPAPLPGMTANVTVTTQMIEDALVVPSRAVSSAAAASVVSVKAEGGSEPRVVTTGVSNGTLIQILSGLELGEEVLVSSGGSTGTQQPAQQQAPGTGGGFGGQGGGGFGGGAGGGGPGGVGGGVR